MALQESGEMYLETILILSQQNPFVRSVDISEHMGYSKPSVSRAVGLLKNGGFITVDLDGYISLTDLGRAEYPLGILLGQNVFACGHMHRPFTLFILFTPGNYNKSRPGCQVRDG